MSIFAFGVKNVLFCLHLFHEISPFYDLFIPIFSILFIVNLVTWTHWVRENVYCPFKRLPLAIISVYFSVFVCWSAVDSCLLSPLFTQLFCCICCTSRCLNLFVRNTATLLTVYLSVFSLLKGWWLVLFVLACSSLSYQNRFQGSQVSRIERDSHSFRSLVTHSRHTSYFSRWKKTLGYLMCRSAQTWPGCAALTMEESSTSPRIPWNSAVRCHLSANTFFFF